MRLPLLVTTGSELHEYTFMYSSRPLNKIIIIINTRTIIMGINLYQAHCSNIHSSFLIIAYRPSLISDYYEPALQGTNEKKKQKTKEVPSDMKTSCDRFIIYVFYL